MKLTHVDSKGKARIVDITDKMPTKRLARARGYIKTTKETISLIKKNQVAKGDVFAVAQIAGVMSAKQTSNLIPLCHPLKITNVKVDSRIIGKDRILVESEVHCDEKTGPDMEALTAVAAACLTIYDMCKAVDKEMTIESICLTEKKGGKQTYVRKKK
jgi:cyclic pyranopterin phosphate synthase